ncbi:hypothetical protein Acsp04_65280 [Actinomadura sp. NBRC 104425]|uniref:hypothetical protein n=1 Tax=Actinomadura sp. NBRC 104425 TaxID=3032204 RepID=UPI0024A2D96D|nr:hypothetical protein [Actinomadura sp. NBRC 104425]GLZ16293.1 hypothetical protein Acsp04_65280 [Actinomadura sp. NBRC 104425]
MNPLPHGEAAVTAPRWQPETPFLGAVDTEMPQQPAQPSRPEADTPFLARYQLGDEIIDAGPAAAQGFAAELLDPEFDEALEELLDEAETLVERVGTDETPVGTARTRRLLEHWIGPLQAEAEAMFEQIASELERERADLLGDTELDRLLERYEPQETDLSPAFENFLGKLKKKMRRAVQGAAKLAKRGLAAAAKLMPIGPLLRKLAGLVRPLLKGVINMALDKLPPAVRPHAAALAKKFTGELREPEEIASAAPAAADVRALQLGLDAEITGLFLAPDETAQEDLLTQAATAGEVESDVLTELDDARARFVERFAALDEGEDPTPLVEEFVPAVLALRTPLRIGIGILGRPKVVSFLARYLGRLIAPYVGPKVTPALSKAIVDQGLRLMSLETPVEPTPDIAGEAFANVVEDTVRQVSALSDEELEDEIALEMAAYEGQQAAVAANFPMELLDPASENLETRRPMGTWVSMPRGRRVRYRKYSRVFPVLITPQTAKAVRTFGGRTLRSFLRDQAGRTGAVQARVHLYHAVPGSRIARILRTEHRNGSIATGPAALHPLTPEAAGMLLGEPGLGHEMEEAYLDRPEPLAVGERLYYLEVPGARTAARRSSDADLALDLRAGEIRLAVFLSEPDAQAIAARLRRKEPLGASLAALRRVYRRAIRNAFARPRGRVRVIGEEPGRQELAGGPPRPTRSRSFSPAAVIERWTTRALGAALARERDAFLAATVADADGVTLVVRLSDPPGLRAIASLVRDGAGPRAMESSADLRGRPRARVEIHPGYRRA